MKQGPTFLVCGEALIDVYPESATHAAPEARIGGSPFNVAIGLARLGQNVGFLGSISRDAFGERLYAALADERVDVSSVTRSDAPTTQSIVGVDAHGAPTFTFLGEGRADRQLTPDAIDRVAHVRAIHVGSYSMVVEPIASTLRALIAQRRDSTLIAWDPNVRVNVVGEAQPWRELLDWMLPRSDLVKLSDEDLSVLAPGLTPQEFAERALSCGVGLVVTTHGAEGVSAWSPRARVQVPASDVKVVDTVGAGDAFHAALLAWLAEHDKLERKRVASMDEEALYEALRFATRAAALTCERRGADLPRGEALARRD
ncbi:MAG TPA: carbohydrate kinase [Gemmatimonadaceae bacterium]|nr:carbohydrate kinase [Gemmatimonadaceae bacterium]